MLMSVVQSFWNAHLESSVHTHCTITHVQEYAAAKEMATGDQPNNGQKQSRSFRKISTRPTVSDLPAALLQKITATPRFKLEQAFYDFAVHLHDKRTANLPNFKALVTTFIEDCNRNTHSFRESSSDWVNCIHSTAQSATRVTREYIVNAGGIDIHTKFKSTRP